MRKMKYGRKIRTLTVSFADQCEKTIFSRFEEENLNVGFWRINSVEDFTTISKDFHNFHLKLPQMLYLFL